MSRTSREEPLRTTAAEWLDTMRDRYKLADVGKAFRCCLNWAAQTDQPISSQRPTQNTDDSPSTLLLLSATKGQWKWLDGTLPHEKYATSILIDTCMDFTAKGGVRAEESIFKIIRCKNNVNGGKDVTATVATVDTPCLGAQLAISVAQTSSSVSDDSKCGCDT
eukprot:CAMPEP_0195514400 /NCGR_PEP_ID=MMETSP0794_2-20130614/5801_1 /TAXON_ID=515487 /ORGANISM="Stephanopyxis turris, Strain CCMP 815" /LENGTH=163 /DNA_ID=CAMNT_0040642641 /DNA_START=35 /DNA_END=526 /DNA_ORIENTATION=-